MVSHGKEGEDEGEERRKGREGEDPRKEEEEECDIGVILVLKFGCGQFLQRSCWHFMFPN